MADYGLVRLSEAIDESMKPFPSQYARMTVNNDEPRGANGRNRDLWLVLMARDRARCWICSRGGTLVIDHLRPRSNFLAAELALADRSDNLRMACWDCNSEKGNRDVPFIRPLPVVWSCLSANRGDADLIDAFCADHLHPCRVRADMPIAGLRGAR